MPLTRNRTHAPPLQYTHSQDISFPCCNKMLCECIFIDMCHRTLTSDVKFTVRVPTNASVNDLFHTLYEVAGCNPDRPYVIVATFARRPQTNLIQRMDGDMLLMDDLGVEPGHACSPMVFFGTTQRELVQVRMRRARRAARAGLQGGRGCKAGLQGRAAGVLQGLACYRL